MTIQEILEAHTVKRPWSEASRMRCKCGEVVIAETEGQLYALHRAHLAEVLDKHMQEREADAWDRAKAAVRGIPFWTDGTNHGFDMCEDEEGLSHETGARMAVMRILDNNFYRKGTTNGR